MSVFTMAQIENITGINAHSLRIWERRYSFLKPFRTDTNIRYYNDEHLKSLLNISILTRNGMRISAIDKMSTETINEAVLDIVEKQSPNSNEDQIAALILAMLEFNENAFEKIFQRQVISDGFLKTMTDTIYPFMARVGSLWTTNRALPAQEHFVSNLVRQKIIYHIENLPEPSERARKIIMFLPSGEYHELGLLLAFYIAKHLSWKVYYLGQDVPMDDVAHLHAMVDADLAFSMITTPLKKTLNELFEPITSTSDLNILISGNPMLFESLEIPDSLIHMSSPNALIERLQNSSAE